MDDEGTRHEDRVRVAVRVRPRNLREEAIESSTKCLHHMDVDAEGGQIYVCKKKPRRNSAPVDQATAVTERELRCSYDRVFGASATQEQVFEYVRDSVQQIAQGFNCTIFTYGQTGTGKTHTMLGADLDQPATTSRETWGIIPRAVESLFEELQSIAHHGAAAAIVHCSYMQIYNNDVFDLLQDNRVRMKEPLVLREMIKGNAKHVYASGLSEFRVTSLTETLQLLHQGNKNRTIRATEYNEKSSRSHAVLQLSIEVESRGVEGPTTIIRRAKLNLVDLAGSEKWDTDVAMGVDRSKELTAINQSLSALGNVISALANAKRTHVPYRDSKLTRLLQDSLGGNTRTTVIATVSQDESAIDETISTLLFAERAKCVTLRVRANEVVDDAVLLAEARREIARLRLLLKKSASHEQLNEVEQKMTKLTRENATLVAENRKLKHTIATMKKERDKAGGVAVARQYPPQQNNAESTVPTKPTTPETERATTANELEDEVAKQQVHATLLEQIQSERRSLERELAQLEQQQTPRRRSGDGDDDDGQSEPLERCPICGLVIDEHSDEELDACIERESATIHRQPQGQQPNARRVRTPRSDGDDIDATLKKPPSPYSQQQLFVPPTVPRPPITPQKSYTQAKIISNTSTLTPQRRSVRDLATTRSASNNNSSSNNNDSDPGRPSTAESHATNQSPPRALRAIVHQGSKSVKALKKFQATSPYNASKGRPRVTSLSSSSSSSGESTATVSQSPASPSPPEGVKCSLQDIGLSLLVYKFRYDCWYPCTVVGYDAKRRLHCCQYEYGDKQWQELSQNKIQIVGRHQQSSSATTTSPKPIKDKTQR